MSVAGAVPPRPRPRLLVVSPSAYPFGGVAVWLDGLVAGLRQRDWPVEVALLAGTHHDVDRYLEQHPLGALGEVRRIENPTGSGEGRRRALAEAIAVSNAQIVLTVNVGDAESAVDRLRRAGDCHARLVTTQHALQVSHFDHLRAGRDVVDGVVVTNRLGVEIAADWAEIARDRIAYAPYAVETGCCLAPRAAGAEPMRIVWSGRIEQRQKRVGDLGPICRGLDAAGVEFRLEIAGAGGGQESLRGELEPFVADGRVEWLGEVPRERLLSAVYPGRDLLLVTSEWETGPIVAWEALVAGLAVVSSAYLGSGREAALRHDETALLFPVGDAAAAVSAIARMRDPALRRRLVAAGQREVGARYSSTASLDAWESALLRFASQAPLPARARPDQPAPAGRLDRWLGARRAEDARRLLRIRHAQRSPGGEWPHALVRSRREAEFRSRAAELDRAASATGVEAAR